MRKVLTLISALCLLFPFSAVSANTYRFHHLTPKDGLPNNAVSCCIQDHLGFLWFGTKDGLCRYDGHEFKVFDGEELGSSINGQTICLSEDTSGNIWFSTVNGVGCFNPETGVVTDVDVPHMVSAMCADNEGYMWMVGSGHLFKYNLALDKLVSYGLMVSSNKNCICRDSYDALWVIADGRFICRYDPSSGGFTPMEILSEEDYSEGESLGCMAKADNGDLLMMTSSGRLVRADARTRTVEFLTERNPFGSRLSAYDLLAVSSEEYWIGCADGLYIYRSPDGLLPPVVSSPDSYYSLSSNNIRSLFQDRDGNIWVCTNFAGVDFLSNEDNGNITYSQRSASYPLAGNVVRAITPDPSGDLWIGTEDGGFNRLFIRDGHTESYGPENGIPASSSIHAIICVGTQVWVVTYDEGILVFDPDRKAVIDRKTVDGKRYECVLRTRDGGIYLGTTAGLYRYDQTGDSFVKQEDFGDNYIHALFQDSYGTLWAGTYGQGMFRKNIETRGSVAEHIEAHGAEGLESRFVTAFAEDHKHQIWVCTEGAGVGVAPLNEEKLAFRHYSRQDGLPSNIASSITEDKDGMLWIATTHRLVLFDPATASVKCIIYNSDNSLGDQYSYGARYLSNSGLIYYGTTEGMFVFNPDWEPVSAARREIFITDISGVKGFNPLPAGETPLTASEIHLSYKESSMLTISYTTLDYSTLHTPSYQYRISRKKVSVDRVTTENTITLTDLRPGTHMLQLGFAGEDNFMPKKTLRIKVGYPPVTSPSAFICYAMLLTGLALTFTFYRKRRIHAEQVRKEEQIEAAKQRELYDAKINFFTNIVHEFRTPLTLIKMPLERIIRNKGYKDSSREDVNTVRENTDRLLELSDQLLDIRKIDKNQMSMTYYQEDVAGIVRKCCANFHPLTKEKGISFNQDIPDGPLETMCSAEAVRKIVDNLVSNAVKYTKNAIKVSLSEKDSNLVLRVDSNSQPIRPEDRDRIFQPFFRVTDNEDLKDVTGAGLGLSYARSLAEQQNGRLYLDNAAEEGNSFVFELPVLRVEDDMDSADDQAPEFDEPVDSSLHTLLLVEDDRKMRHFLARELADEYNIFTAHNGAEAVELLGKERIDMVISDIMMPQMDGNELCQYIKNNVEISHIPIILITAAVGVEMRIETLKVGADGYIEKPFSIELLKVNIENLFHNKEIANYQFANSPLTHFTSVVTNNIDQLFMDKLHAVIMRNISDENLNYETLVSMMGTSRSTLYRKIKANTGLNSSEYIRLCRLKKAAEMLASNEYRVNEVADLVGFSSPSYFATCFQKQFGLTPTAFVKEIRQ